MKTKYSSYENHKIHAISLFINSQKNICSDCEIILHKLMTLHEEGSFLALIKARLYEYSLKTPEKNDGFPYAFISVSAHELYTAHCKETLIQDAIHELDNETESHNVASEKFRHLNLSIKQLAGKVILSTSENWLDDKVYEDNKAYLKDKLVRNEIKIPFYTGFKSATDNLGDEITDNLDYDLPYFSNGFQIFTIGNSSDG